MAIALAVLITLGFTLVARADDDDQPTTGVARVSVIHGDVSMQRGDSGDWVAASVNAPVMAGDWLTTGKRSRTELQLDYANVLRLGDDSEAKVADLTRTHIQVQVRRGLANFAVFKGSEADVEIDTPNVAVRPVIDREGEYRIEVISEDETRVIVRQGEADVTTPQGSTTAKKGDLITIRGRDNPEYQVSNAPHTDSWDDWNKDRDHQILDAESYRRTNRYYTGVSDLDRHGHWIYVDDYGWVWSPYAYDGWAPYRYGRWVWEPYWGWTWVSYEPWGWAPYHYGRWFLYGSSWCWWPGPIVPFYRPLWAPAYVSFFGFGRHWGVSVGFGFGSIGWLPIGPRDYYYPWWGGYRRNINVVNVTNITNITNVTNVYRINPLGRGRGMRSNVEDVMRDARLQRGVTTMASDRFGREAVPRTGRPVVTPAELRQGRLVAGNVPVVPTRDSLRPVDRAVNRPAGMARDNNRDRFFTRSQPTTRPESFHSEAAQVRDAVQARERGGRGPNPAMDARGNSGANANPRDRRNDATPNVGGRSREANGALGQRPQTPASDQAPGWRRFGDRGNAGGAQAQSPARDRQTPSRERSQAPAREPRQAGPQRESSPRGQSPSNDRSGWEKFTPRERNRQTPTARPNTSPDSRRSSPERINPSEERRPNRAPSADERGGGYRSFTPQPERSERPSNDRGGGNPGRSTDYPRGDRGYTPDRSMDSPRGDRGYTPDRGSSAQRGPQGWDRGAARESGRRPLEMQRPIVVPRAERSAPSGGGGRQGGGQGSRGNNPPPRQSGGSSPRQRPR